MQSAQASRAPKGVTPSLSSHFQRGSGALLGLAFAEAWAGQQQQGAHRVSVQGGLSSDGGWGEVMLANIALGAALLATPDLPLLDLLRRYQHQDGRRLLDPYARPAHWPATQGRAPLSNPGLQVPLVLQLLPLVLFGRADGCLPTLLQTRLALEPQGAALRGVLSALADGLAALIGGQWAALPAVQQALLHGMTDCELSPEVARAHGLADLPLVVQMLAEPDAMRGLQQLWQQAQVPYFACCLFGVLAGAWRGEHYWPVIGMYRVPGGVELKDLAWMLGCGLTAAEWLLALRCLSVDDADHRALRPYNRLLQCLPVERDCEVPLRSAFGLSQPLQQLLAEYRDSLLPSVTSQAQVSIAPLIARLMQYAQWLSWPLGWPQPARSEPEACC